MGSAERRPRSGSGPIAARQETAGADAARDAAEAAVVAPAPAPVAAPTGAVILPRSGAALSRAQVVADLRLAMLSRHASMVGRREVLSGRAKFGIFGDGKEVAQLALAHAMRPGDWRAGYYRDQTLGLATGLMTLPQFFAQLYADADTEREPHSGGRQMNNHLATRILDGDGRRTGTLGALNSSADLSPLAAWMPRLVGLAWASSLYRADPGLAALCPGETAGGDEIAFGTIGDASTSEGLFWESVNAAAVLQVPMLLSVWDDGYGISVPTRLQTAKGSISAALRGMEASGTGPGYRIEVVRGWDYPALCDTFLSTVQSVRETHQPAIVHVVDLTQPTGHSTSGSHERYKPKERLQWERETDCILRMRRWVLDEGLATEAELDAWDREAREEVEESRAAAEEARLAPIRRERSEVVDLLRAANDEAPDVGVAAIVASLESTPELNRRAVDAAATRALWAMRGRELRARPALEAFLRRYRGENRRRYSGDMLSESDASPLLTPLEEPAYTSGSEMVDGRVVLQRCFAANFERDPRLLVLGEDVGRLGDVNLVFEGLQERFGESRLTDTGIREATILGQAIGAALRGLRPVADIQYLDYLLYALQLMSDDLASLRWRTAGGQAAPVTIRTKGHRLQGVWHAGSPMGAIIHAVRGIHVAVPRDCTRAAGLYNTLLRGDDPALVIEVLNGYRLKERVPDNIGTFTIPLGQPETLRSGRDMTIVTYGACCRVALEAAEVLSGLGVEAEIVDVQTLLPFDLDGAVARSLARTGAVLFLDEDVPGGASAYMMREVLERQGGFWHLDAAPRTLTAAESRTPYATDGEYYTKPSVEDVVRACWAIARDRDGSLPAIDVEG